MICAWNELLAILPHRLRQSVDVLGKSNAQEIRLRLDKIPELHLGQKRITLEKRVTQDELNFVVNTASRYSPWASASAASGYITAPGGHRIGLGGEVVIKDGQMSGFRSIRSVNIRVARDFPGVAAKIANIPGNLLIIGRPGSGKTTLLRDLIRQRSFHETVSVVDERCELFPQGMNTGVSVDILTGCSKQQGIDAVLRTMGPDTIAVDEITASADCEAMVYAGWCGVRLIATVHGAGMDDLYTRKVYKPLIETGLFDYLVTVHPDKSYTAERMKR